MAALQAECLLVRQRDLCHENQWLHERSCRKREQFHEELVQRESLLQSLRHRCSDLEFVNNYLTRKKTQLEVQMNEMKRILSDVYAERGVWKPPSKPPGQVIVRPGPSHRHSRTHIPILPEPEDEREEEHQEEEHISNLNDSSTSPRTQTHVTAFLEATQTERNLTRRQTESLKRQIQRLEVKLRLRDQEIERLKETEIERVRLLEEEGVSKSEMLEYSVRRLRRRVLFLENELEKERGRGRGMGGRGRKRKKRKRRNLRRTIL